MSDSRSNRQKAEELFQGLLQLPPEEQQLLLDREDVEPEVRGEVERLLSVDGRLPESLVAGVLDASETAPVRQSAPGRGDVEPSAPTASSRTGIDHGRFVPGKVVAGRYRIVGLLGRGGTGEVYRADDLELGQAVALKFLPDRLSRDNVSLERFRNEVRLSRQISHPNVCRVYDIGQADGAWFLSMEYVDGEDLSSLLNRIGRFPRDRAVEVVRELCLGLGAAHDKGVLHRDLKPASIMIDGRGKLLITDFGLAEFAGQVPAGEAAATFSSVSSEPA